MADIKESAMSTASDFEYVRALDANGNSIRISKADLVSVVEELIGAVNSTKNGLATSSMYNNQGFVKYQSARAYNLGAGYRGFIMGGRDSAFGLYFVDGSRVFQLSKSATISFYMGSSNNMYADSITGFYIRSMPLESPHQPITVSDFNPDDYTLIEPINLSMNT